MTRVFRPNELKQAVLEALAESGPANGYTLMQVLAERIGPTWRPSPGAVYPALLALEDLGLVGAADNGGGRSYHLEPSGLEAVDRHAGTLDRVARRARSVSRETDVGTRLDRFAAVHPARRHRIDATTADRIDALLAGTAREINAIVTQPEEKN